MFVFHRNAHFTIFLDFLLQVESSNFTQPAIQTYDFIAVFVQIVADSGVCLVFGCCVLPVLFASKQNGAENSKHTGEAVIHILGSEHVIVTTVEGEFAFCCACCWGDVGSVLRFSVRSNSLCLLKRLSQRPGAVWLSRSSSPPSSPCIWRRLYAVPLSVLVVDHFLSCSSARCVDFTPSWASQSLESPWLCFARAQKRLT